MNDEAFEHEITRLLESRNWDTKRLKEIDADVQTMIFAAMRVHMASSKCETPTVQYTMGRSPPPIKPLSFILARCYSASLCCCDEHC